MTRPRRRCCTSATAPGDHPGDGVRQTGPYRSARPCDGPRRCRGAAINGEPDGQPLLRPSPSPTVAGLVAAFATMVAVHSGVGQVVDVNLVESMLQLMGPLVPLYGLLGQTQERRRSIPHGARNTYRGGREVDRSLSAQVRRAAVPTDRARGRRAVRQVRAASRCGDRRRLRSGSARTSDEVLAEFDGCTPPRLRLRYGRHLRRPALPRDRSRSPRSTGCRWRTSSHACHARRARCDGQGGRWTPTATRSAPSSPSGAGTPEAGDPPSPTCHDLCTGSAGAPSLPGHRTGGVTPRWRPRCGPASTREPIRAQHVPARAARRWRRRAPGSTRRPPTSCGRRSG